MPVSGAGAKQKGAEFEREMAKLLGGERMVMSGGSSLGGGDISFHNNPTSIFADWFWECKRRAVVPEIIRLALEQANVGLSGHGARRKPAAAIRGDRGRAIVAFYADDFVEWALALAELGQGQRVKAIARQMQALLRELEAAA